MAATLTLRHGNDNRVEGNFFLGGGINNSGGIRVIGERQTIVNNYIANVDDRAGGAISISAGVPNSELNQYYLV
jgi:poly(beta-D-mannuronate) lyase